MKLFARHGGYWLFWTSAVYLAVAFYCAVYYPDTSTALVQFVWILIAGLPLFFPPLGRWLNLDIEWDRKMIDWFNTKEDPKYVPEGMCKSSDEKVKPEVDKMGKAYYRIGLTDDNRLSFSMGYSEIQMTKLGVQQMIEQLETFMNYLPDTVEEK